MVTTQQQEIHGCALRKTRQVIQVSLSPGCPSWYMLVSAKFCLQVKNVMFDPADVTSCLVKAIAVAYQ